MENILAKTGFVALSMLVAFFFSHPQVEAATFKVKCNKGKTIQKAIDRVKPGDVIQVSGTCNERVEIGEQVQNITIDGQGTATVNSTDPNRSTFFVRGRGITIKGFFSIRGGSNGINVNRGGAARIADNTIEYNGHGIFVSEGSSARIGFISALATVASPNVIQNNVFDGIDVRRGSSARIVGNTISGNGRHGVDVTRVSHAELALNTINSNTRDGIRVEINSSVLLGSGIPFLNGPNVTTANNTRFGVRCFTGSVASGQLGTLNGGDGPTNFGPPAEDDTCIENLSDFP